LSSKSEERSFKPIESNAGFLLDLEGRKVITLRVPSKVAEEISGEEPQTSGGILSRLKAKLGFGRETEHWLTITSVDNPLLEDNDKFGAVVAQELTTATGTTITKSNLAISVSVPITRTESRLQADKGLPNPSPVTN
jgi:hypothetical protein